MTDLRAKVAYLQGLAEGLEIEASSSEGRILGSMIDVLGDLADQVMDVTEAQAELAGYVEDVDFDLGSLEQTIFGDDDEEITFIPDEAVLSDGEVVEIVDDDFDEGGATEY